MSTKRRVSRTAPPIAFGPLPSVSNNASSQNTSVAASSAAPISTAAPVSLSTSTHAAFAIPIAKATDDATTAQAVNRGVKRLENVHYDPKTMLDPTGLPPGEPNVLDQRLYNQAWTMKRVLELLALYDDTLYQFVSLVEPQIGESLRELPASGASAVSEVFNQAAILDKSLFRGNIPAWADDFSKSKLTPEEVLAETNRYRPEVALKNKLDRDVVMMLPVPNPATLPPVAARPDSAINTLSLHGSTPQMTAGAPPVLSTSALPHALRGGGGDTASSSSLPPPRDALGDGLGGNANTHSDVPTNIRTRDGEQWWNINDGRLVAVRMMANSHNVNESVLKLWDLIYNDGRLYTANAANTLRDERKRAMHDRIHRRVSEFATTAAAAANSNVSLSLDWRMLPEHVGMLFFKPLVTSAINTAATAVRSSLQTDDARGTLAVRQSLTIHDLVASRDPVRSNFADLVALYIKLWRAESSTSRETHVTRQDLLRRINARLLHFENLIRTPIGLDYGSTYRDYAVTSRMMRESSESESNRPAWATRKRVYHSTSTAADADTLIGAEAPGYAPLTMARLRDYQQRDALLRLGMNNL